MDLFRVLATFSEAPTERTSALTDLLGLSPAPTQTTYTDVFVLQQIPHASAYLSEDGMLGGEPSDRIAGFWRAIGIEPPPDPDHLAAMLGLYATLGDHASLVDDSRYQDARLRARHAFLWEHLLPWLPVYLHGIARHAPAPFPAWAALLLDAMLDDARQVGGPATLPLHLRALEAAAPRPADGLADMVDLLLAPARSGMVVTHADLARAAETIATGLRAGSRRLVLRSLLEQEASGLLDWVQGEAAHWEAFHRSLIDPLGPVGSFWAGRAAATGALAETLRRDVAYW